MFRRNQAPARRRRAFRRWPSAGWIVLGALLAWIALRATHDQWLPSGARGAGAATPAFRGSTPISGPCEVLQVIAGDTLVVRQTATSASGGEQRIEERIRLLGIASPETPPWAAASAEHTRSLIAGKDVRLELDKRRVDRYGDYLAYVHCDGELLNETLLRAGLARLDSYPGDNMSIVRRLSRAEAQARRGGIGIWTPPTQAQSMPVR